MSNARWAFTHLAVISVCNWNFDPVFGKMSCNLNMSGKKKLLKGKLFTKRNIFFLFFFFTISLLANCHAKLKHSFKNMKLNPLEQFQTFSQINRHSNVSWNLANLQCLHYFTIRFFFKEIFYCLFTIFNMHFSSHLKTSNARGEVSA